MKQFNPFLQRIKIFLYFVYNLISLNLIKSSFKEGTSSEESFRQQILYNLKFLKLKYCQYIKNKCYILYVYQF